VIHDARHVAIRASGSELILTRHLVGAWVRRAIHDPTSRGEGPLSGLIDMYAGPSSGESVDHAYLAFLADRYGASNEEDLEAWRAFILNRPRANEMPPTVLDRVTRDREEDKDHLGRDHEFDAFASLLAARNADPPIAVGLFGDWGAGKSHFIRQLQARVAAYAEEARNADEAPKRSSDNGLGAGDLAARLQPGPTPYCAHIIQIDFNAWHYVDANLWASLVDRILEGLSAGLSMRDSTNNRIYREDAVRELDAVLQDELKLLRDAEHARKSEVDRLQAEVEEARKKVSEVVNDAETLRRHLSCELARNARTEALKAITRDLSGLVPALDGAAKSLGYKSGEEALAAAADIIADSRGLAGRARAAISIVLNRPREHLPWLALGAGGLVLAPVLGTLAEALTKSVIDVAPLGNSTNSAAFVATLLATCVPVIAAFLKKADSALQAFQQADANLRQKEAELDREIASRIGATEAELKTKESALTAAELQLVSVQGRSNAIRDRLATLSAHERVAFFVNERLAEGTYERHLGLISTIRRDLQRLSELLRDEGKNVPVRGTSRRKKASSPTQVQRIERIILYVDDLDRCPPDRVVEVLQAIRLLLSFPLFVVVVGVDVRWVASALHQRFGDLLALDGPGERTNSASAAQATAMDYLEKIFQIPFWIAPMSADDAGRLIRGIVDIETIGEPPYREPSGQSSPTTVPSEIGDLISIVTATDDPELVPQEIERGADAAEGLKLYRHELEAMSRLGEIAGRTPRATKRFLNLYRVLKGADSRTRSRRFLGEDGQYRAVLVLLAVVCGRPSSACRFLRALWHEKEQLDLASFARTRMINSENDPEWRELGACLERAAQNLKVPDIDTNVDRHVTIAALKEWLPLASRFSFEKWRPQ
jgi:sugar-specific transcriptional regulator TrmB